MTRVISSSMPRGEELSDTMVDRFIAATLAMRRSAKIVQAQRYQIDGKAVTPVQVDVLETLLNHKEMSMGNLSKAIRVDPAAASRAVVRLEDLGFLSRRTDFHDGRIVVVAATQKGRRVATKILRERREVTRTYLGEMASDKAKLLIELLEENVTLSMLLLDSESRAPRSILEDD